jgi:hypothetical protein
LKSPSFSGTYWYLLLDYGTSADYSVNVYWAKAAFTGGSTTARPTSTDEWANQGSALQFIDSAQGTTVERLSMALSSRGDFWTTFIKNGVAFSNRVIHFQMPAGASALDLYPVWNYAMWSGSSGGAYTASISAANNIFSRQWDGLATNGYNWVLVSPFGNGHWLDPLANSWIMSPVHTYHSAQSIMAYRGRLQDVFVSSGTSYPTTNNQVIREAGVIKWASVGSMWLPSDAAIA